MLRQIQFRAMNTDVGIWLWQADPQAETWLQDAAQRFAAIEAELSRFQPDSGLSRLNGAAGAGPQPVSPLLWAVVSAALDAARRSQGLFDPTLVQLADGTVLMFVTLEDDQRRASVVQATLRLQ